MPPNDDSTAFRFDDHARRLGALEVDVKTMTSTLTEHRIETKSEIHAVSTKIDQAQASLKTLGWVAALIGPLLAAAISFLLSRLLK